MAIQGAVEKLLSEPGTPISPSVETDVQNALNVLRRDQADAALVQAAEQISVILFTAQRAWINRRTNLYASQLLRLRRAVGCLSR